MTDKELFERNPRDYVVMLHEEGIVSVETLLTACLKYMSHDDCKEMCELNQIEPDNIFQIRYCSGVTIPTTRKPGIKCQLTYPFQKQPKQSALLEHP